MGFKSLFPKNTIVGKAMRGDNAGAISSAKNYVKSGELLQDVKNVGRIVATGGSDVGAWKSMGQKAYGDEIKKLLNPNAPNLPSANLKASDSLNSLTATKAQLLNLSSAQVKRDEALMVGSGINRKFKAFDKIPLSKDMNGASISDVSFETKTNIDTTTLIAIGVGAFLLLKK